MQWGFHSNAVFPIHSLIISLSTTARSHHPCPIIPPCHRASSNRTQHGNKNKPPFVNNNNKKTWYIYKWLQNVLILFPNTNLTERAQRGAHEPMSIQATLPPSNTVNVHMLLFLPKYRVKHVLEQSIHCMLCVIPRDNLPKRVSSTPILKFYILSRGHMTEDASFPDIPPN